MKKKKTNFGVVVGLASSRRWGLEIKSELSEWGPVALVSLQHTQTWKIEPADYQTKEDEKKKKPPKKRREKNSTRRALNFVPWSYRVT